MTVYCQFSRNKFRGLIETLYLQYHLGVTQLDWHDWQTHFSRKVLMLLVFKKYIFLICFPASGLSCSLQHVGFSSCVQAPEQAGWEVAMHGLSFSVHLGSQFPLQGQNLSTLHWMADSQSLDYQGSPFSSRFYRGRPGCLRRMSASRAMPQPFIPTNFSPAATYPCNPHSPTELMPILQVKVVAGVVNFMCQGGQAIQWYLEIWSSTSLDVAMKIFLGQINI